ncbi:phage protein NinX family protein [Pseudomonas shirazensis]|uniref:Phage protein NinX family protein n=1 Tax=Pseudomonas shirazensis TaxID=2745494 RepID=A0ABU8ZU19_9PSED
MIEVKTASLVGSALDWAVAVATDAGDVDITENGVSCIYQLPEGGCWTNLYQPSVDWSQAGPLITEYQVALIPEAHDGKEGTERSGRWGADVYYKGGEQYTTEHCDTALIAACQAIVATEFGDTVQVPKELLP